MSDTDKQERLRAVAADRDAALAKVAQLEADLNTATKLLSTPVYETWQEYEGELAEARAEVEGKRKRIVSLEHQRAQLRDERNEARAKVEQLRDLNHALKTALRKATVEKDELERMEEEVERLREDNRVLRKSLRGLDPLGKMAVLVRENEQLRAALREAPRGIGDDAAWLAWWRRVDALLRGRALTTQEEQPSGTA